MNKFNIDEAASGMITSEEIRLFFNANGSGFIFEKNIERARHYSDLAIYYLEASYVCEEIAALGESDSFEVDWNCGRHPVARFVMIPHYPEELHELLCGFCRALSGEYEDEEDELMWLESLEEYKDNIQNRELRFPELADDYFANLINGAYLEHESEYGDPEEFYSLIKKESPEHLFGFWKCMYSDTIRQQFYVSKESWIIPPQSDITEILRKYSSIEELNFEEGNLFSLNGSYYVINENYVFVVSYHIIAKALQCVSFVFNEERSLRDRHDWLHSLHANHRIKISDSAGFLLFTFNDYSIILWNQYKLNFNDICKLNREAAAVFFTTSALIGLQKEISCDWSQLNDESFEELCYDLVYYDSKFDKKTIRKMGKSRSRDGGRDIVVYTHARLGYMPEKYIFQCKLIKPQSSLGASKVQDISDIIEQYNADGYGIFTSGTIDTTLHDKIDAITERKQVKKQLYSKHELERDLALFPQLKERYFQT